jgi:RIO kinase 1
LPKHHKDDADDGAPDDSFNHLERETIDTDIIELDELEFFSDEETTGFERFHDPRVKALEEKKARLKLAPEAVEAEAKQKEGPQWTYKAGKQEAAWMIDALENFFRQPLIDDVLFSVKGGKEASVYCCHTHPEAADLIGEERVAAKIYRPRMFRNLRNDAMYRTGRALVAGIMKGYMQESRGKSINKGDQDQRMQRALQKKSKFAMEVSHTSWMSYEYNTLLTLHEAGARVPRPFAMSPNGILMAFTGTNNRGAATLIEVGLDKKEAVKVFAEVKRNIKIMANFGIAHGDLSAYNILYLDGEITIIDFPQVVRFGENPYIEQIVRRDMTRLCEYFDKQGVACDPEELLEEVGYMAQINAHSASLREAEIGMEFEGEFEDEDEFLA